MASQLEEVGNLQSQLVQIQTTLTQAISNLNGQIEEMKKDELNLTKANKEIEIFLLKLSLYTADFDEKICAIQTIKAEQDRLKKDLLNSRLRNEQLQEEAEILRKKMLQCFFSCIRSRKSSRSSRPEVSTSSTSSCPK